MSENRLQIAFLTSSDSRNKRTWSGMPYYMSKALERNVGNVDYLGPVNLRFSFFKGKVISFFCQKILKKRFDYFHSLSVAKSYAKIFSKKLNEKKYDLIFAPASSEIAYINTDIPIVYISDTTIELSRNYHKALTNLLECSYRQAIDIEKAVLKKATIISYPTSWAAKSAISDFNTPLEKIFVIPFGANIDESPSPEIAYSRKLTEKCRLFFLGVNWEEKGGTIAIDTLNALINMGIDAELTICGCVPYPKISHSKIKIIPFLDKNDEKQLRQLIELFINSDFLILPTRFEAYGLVICEASAFGLLSIASDTGGVSGVIKENVNGFLLSLDATGYKYAQKIASIFSDEKKYQSLAISSRKLYEEKLNWDSWALQIKSACEKIILNKK